MENIVTADTVVEKDIAAVVLDAFKPELEAHVEEELLKAADQVGLGDVAGVGVKVGTIYGLIKGMYGLENYVHTLYGSLSPFTEIFVGGCIVVGIGFCGHLVYKWLRSPASKEFKEEVLEHLPEEKKVIVKALIK